MTKYLPPSINTIGLKKFLDKSAVKHNGHGYKDFLDLVNSRGAYKNIPFRVANLARVFGVSQPTAWKWYKAHLNTDKKVAKKRSATDN